MPSFMNDRPLLAGAPNFRDLGGYRTRNGRRLRYNLVFRSEGLAELTRDDLEVVRKLGIRLICDLRSEREREQVPTRWPENSPVNTLHLDIAADLRAEYAVMSELLLASPSTEGANQAMLTTYRQFPTAFAGRLPQFFEQILAGSNLPLVFHCAAGKDRTGFVAALLLTALEVPLDDIIEDYLLTARRWNGQRGEAAIRQALFAIFGEEPPTAVIQPLMMVKEEYLAAAFDVIEQQYKTVDAYLEQVAGLGAKQRLALQHLLLE
ncbi:MULTISPECIES: tyrosine-protein phosphatase [unclassified Pseudomonas]|uniref:tyrosine-protein phosphatase n=1 Tax=unclassified Pseudomonas TaxID=196821 RepID=UPI0013047DD2|nr:MULTISPECIES: tyrosine-protein phosphatase [unclassified Pseudomonas]